MNGQTLRFVRDGEGHCLNACPHLRWVASSREFHCSRYDKRLKGDRAIGFEPMADRLCLRGAVPLTAEQKQQNLDENLWWFSLGY